MTDTPKPWNIRHVTGHEANPVEGKITIVAADERGPGGDNHLYLIGGLSSLYANPSLDNGQDDMPEGFDSDDTIGIVFQNGPIPDNGINGVTLEALLTVCIDRLEACQSGKFACEENGAALQHLVYAREHLHQRTRKRQAALAAEAAKQ